MHLALSKVKSMSDTCQQCLTSLANHRPHLLVNMVFNIKEFIWKRFLPSPPPPHSFLFWVSPIFAPKTPFLVFPSSRTPQKRLLCKLSLIGCFLNLIIACQNNYHNPFFALQFKHWRFLDRSSCFRCTFSRGFWFIRNWTCLSQIFIFMSLLVISYLP